MVGNKILLYFALVTFANQVSVSHGQFLPLFDWLWSIFGNYEEPPFNGLRNITDDVEERLYPPQHWACVEGFATPHNWESKSSEMFMTLYSYIQGKNDVSKKIEMTVPVSTKVDQRNGDLNSYEMCFYIPKEYQLDPPKPMNPSNTRFQLKIVKFPELRQYCKKYGGYASDTINKEQLTELTQVLKKQNLSYFEQDQGPRATYFLNGYDAPTKFWNRRNEICVLGSDTKNVDFFTLRH